MYCPVHAGVKGNDQADRLAGKVTITSSLHLGRSEVLRSLRHYLRAQSQGHHTIGRLDERGVERGTAQRSSLKGRERAIFSQTNTGTVSKATLGKLHRDGVRAIPSAYTPPWTEQNWTVQFCLWGKARVFNQQPGDMTKGNISNQQSGDIWKCKNIQSAARRHKKKQNYQSAASYKTWEKAKVCNQQSGDAWKRKMYPKSAAKRREMTRKYRIWGQS